MKKLTLDQLEVESFASQPSEEELTHIKGGTGWYCQIPTWIWEAYQWATEDDVSQGSQNNSIKIKDGNTLIEVVYSDSASVVTPDSAYVIKAY